MQSGRVAYCPGNVYWWSRGLIAHRVTPAAAILRIEEFWELPTAISSNCGTGNDERGGPERVEPH